MILFDELLFLHLHIFGVLYSITFDPPKPVTFCVKIGIIFAAETSTVPYCTASVLYCSSSDLYCILSPVHLN